MAESQYSLEEGEEFQCNDLGMEEHFLEQLRLNTFWEGRTVFKKNTAENQRAFTKNTVEKTVFFTLLI